MLQWRRSCHGDFLAGMAAAARSPALRILRRTASSQPLCRRGLPTAVGSAQPDCREWPA